ncbi:hypothetical protein AMATHDRAFT_66878 [Amanita thiersii Skay4041]|uniref:Uncharacterized protein n=1 Tax=Amanita thiersii Skay4041 TaxID=703135 RepID=A0A2A9NJ34_9AGAR|nr:hypothetical protein AMATHDRAFT_66878 [Amanita thiersii Skay4041]
MEGATNSFKNSEPIALVQLINLFKWKLEHDHHPQTIHVLPDFRTKVINVQSGLAEQVIRLLYLSCVANVARQSVGKSDENSRRKDAMRERDSQIDKMHEITINQAIVNWCKEVSIGAVPLTIDVHSIQQLHESFLFI